MKVGSRCSRGSRVISSTMLFFTIISFIYFATSNIKSLDAGLFKINYMDPVEAPVLYSDHMSASKHEKFDPATAFREIMIASPIVLFIRGDHASSQYLKNLLQMEYEITPPIAVVDLSKHVEGNKLQEFIILNKILTHNTPLISSEQVPDVPYLFMNGISLINTYSGNDIKVLHLEGKLEKIFKAFSNSRVSVRRLSLPSNS